MKRAVIALLCAACEPTLPWDGHVMLRVDGAAAVTTPGTAIAALSTSNDTGSIDFSARPSGDLHGLNLSFSFTGPLSAKSDLSLLYGSADVGGEQFASSAATLTLASVAPLDDAGGTVTYEIHGSLSATLVGNDSGRTLSVSSSF